MLAGNTRILAQENKFTELKGEYLGQKKPGLTPMIFAPGVVSTENDFELNSTFTPDGKEFSFTTRKSGKSLTMMFMKQINGRWTKPQVLPFSGKDNDVDQFISPDGKKFLFCSTRLVNNKKRGFDLWAAERTSTGWTEPKNMGSLLNTENNEFYPTMSLNGTLYFAATRKEGYGKGDIYYSKFVNGQYTKPINLGPAVNGEHSEHDAAIAKDESFIIFSLSKPTDNFGKDDLYICFRKQNGAWTKAKNMGKVINSAGTEFCPVISQDEKYLFFTRDGDIYWVSIEVIQPLK